MDRRLLRRSFILRWTVAALFALLAFAPAADAAQAPYGQIVVFGDSLSDSGNAFALRHAQSIPPYDTLDALLIPSAPYAKGGHHFSNGATWVEQFARPSGLAGSVRPAFQGAGVKASNYAVGGARAYDDGINVDLGAQVNAFLTDAGGKAPSDALYVVEFGGNDVRDALAALASGGDPATIIGASLASIGSSIEALHAAGAKKFLVWNAPDLRVTPAIHILDSVSPGASQAIGVLEQTFNAGLGSLLAQLSGLPGIEIKLLDAFQKVNDIAADPAAYGLDVVNAACVTPDVSPFDCQRPDDYLFWDGIHPTKVVHTIFAQEAAFVLAH